LSQFFWIEILKSSMPKAPDGSGGLRQFGYILVREAPGIILVLAYFVFLPPAMVFIPFFKRMFVKLGFIRYMVMANLLLLMATLPIKMVLRWTLNLKYIVSIPEYFLNF